jgi:hypothetical protein
MQHHYRHCGNAGCTDILAAELFRDGALIADEINCGHSYIAPQQRDGWNDGVGLGYDPFDGEPVFNVGGIGFEPNGQIDINVGGLDFPI